MASLVEFINPLDHVGWDEWVGQWRHACVFHGAAWARTLTEAYGFAPAYAVIRRGGGLQAVLPMVEVRGFGTRRRAVGLPFSDFCTALVSEPDDGRRLVQEVLREAPVRGWRTVEFRGSIDTDAPASPALSFCTHDVDLGGTEEDQWKRCNPSVRRAVRKARNAELAVRCGCSDFDLDEFFRLFSMTRRRHGLPPPPRTFFRALQRQVLQPGFGTVVTATRAGCAVAASMFMRFGTEALFKYGASDQRFQSDRPSDLVIWEGLRWCRGQGCRTLSLGKSRSSQEGLRRFKMGWGAREGRLDYFTYDLYKGQYVVGRDSVEGWYNSVFRNLPLPVLQLAGRLLYRQAA